MTPQEKLELLLDLIADELIVSEFVNTTNVEDNQKFILNGQLQRGGGEGALFQKDIKANQEDLNQTTIINEGTEDEQVIPKLQEIANRITDFNTLFISINSGENGISIELSNGGLASSELITDLIIQGGEFSNTSQFISLKQQKSNIDIDKAEEFLDTNIFELLPTGDTRQSRIVRFFQELNALIPTDLPNFDTDNNGVVDRAQDGTWDGATEYSQDNSISYAQDNPEESNIDEENAAFHRLKDTANDTNSSLTIEDIYNTIEPYLTDILEDPITPQDERPEYVNQSSGYLKFRNLNQGIVIRNTNKDFIEHSIWF